jgi:hypothetical protein
MPLRDHFHSPLAEQRRWSGIHAQWAGMIVLEIGRNLSQRFAAEPRIQLANSDADCGGSALTDQDAFEVNIHDTAERNRLVAVVMIVSPANKNSSAECALFAEKCCELIRQRVCVSIIDVVAAHDACIYPQLLDYFGQRDDGLPSPPPSIYAATCRWTRLDGENRLQTWFYPLQVGAQLSTLPVWLSPNVAIPLDLESSYEATCRALRIG